MLDQVGVRAARGFEGVGQERHAVERALRIDAVGERFHLARQPSAALWHRAEWVSEKAMNERSLRPVLGDRGGGIEDVPLAPQMRRSPSRVSRCDEGGAETVALV